MRGAGGSAGKGAESGVSLERNKEQHPLQHSLQHPEFCQHSSQHPPQPFSGFPSFLEGREPPLTLRRENQYLYFGRFFPCTLWPFSCSTGLFVYHSHRAGPVLQEFWACTTGWCPALYLCTPTPALGLGVVA